MKRFVGVFLALALTLCLLPVPARAASGAWDGSVDISWYDPAKSEYYLSTPAQLAGLAALVNGMADPSAKSVKGDKSYLKSIRYDGVLLVGAGGGNVSDTVYTSNIDFAHKTVYLTRDLDMGGVYNAQTGTWSGPNWTPIGGKFPMKPNEAAGDCLTLDTRFNGVLDGQGHTISHLYCSRYAAKGFPYSMAIGLVGFLGGPSDENSAITGTFTDGWQPAVRNLVVSSGYVYGRRMVGGVVGRVGKTSNGVVIENCANKATVRNTDSKGVGGICGAAWGKGSIRSCYNTGSVSTVYVCPAGGILGTNEGMDVSNCYSTGKIDTNGAQYGRAIGSHDSGTYTVSNCWYLTGSDDDAASNGYYKGTSRKITVSVSGLSAAELKSAAFLEKLNGNGAVFAADAAGKNGGYPVLWFENAASSAKYTVTLAPAEHGKVASSASGSVPLGTTLSLTAEPDAGYTLESFTVNGKKISGGFWAVTGDCAVGAVFKKLLTAAVSIPSYDEFYLSVARTGWKLDPDGRMVWSDGETLSSGDTVLEGNVLTLRTHVYSDAEPADPALEYRDDCSVSVTNASKNSDGTFTVTAAGPVQVSARRSTQKKTWLSLADTSWYTGRAKTYTLTTPAQLAGLAELVNSRGVTFAGVTVLLGNDLTLANPDGTSGERVWTVIGTSLQRSFQGVFDGQGHAILSMAAWREGSYAALFGCCKNALIRDLTVTGTARGEAASSYAAGILAWGSATTLKNCASYAAVTAAGTHAGGLAAYLSDGSRLENCQNYGAVTGQSGVGGLAGVSYSAEDTITGCANFGAVTGAGSGTYGTGGLVGRLAGSLSLSCNYGAVSGTDRYLGGLAGYTTARSRTSVTLCRSAGAVSSSASGAYAGGLVGYAQNLLYGGCEDTSGAAQPLGRNGTVAEKTVAGELPSFKPAAAPAEIAAAPLPASTPAARQNLVQNGRVTASGTYYIPWFYSGAVTVADGLTVTLIGTDSGLNYYENVAIACGKGAILTLENVRLTGSTTLLSLGAGSTLRLSGESRLEGLCDTPEDPCPTVYAAGDLTIEGPGALAVSATVNNAAVLVAPGSRVALASGTLSVTKLDKLGFAGGGFWANGSSVEISGGTLCGYTDSDNVAVLSADDVAVTGGTLRLQAAKSSAAVEGALTLKNCSALLLGHSGNSAKKSLSYAGAAAAPGLKAQSGVAWQKAAFSDVRADSLYWDDVVFAAHKGWLKGVSASAFSPDGTLTRAMFVTALWRLAGRPAASGELPFADVASGSWYRAAVLWAYQKGIASGTSKTAFSPDAAVTVAEAAVFLARYSGGSGEASALPDYASGPQWSLSALSWAYGGGLFDASAAALADAARPASRALLARLLRAYSASRS